MFHGFSPETMDFLWGIRMNNERDWFWPINMSIHNIYTNP